MKRFAIAALFVVTLVGPTIAQAFEESPLFVKTIYVEKVYMHQLGYKVTYVTSDLSLRELYIPMNWFGITAGKAEIIFGSDRAYPYMHIYWDDGEFSHIELHVQDNFRHLSWGAIDQTQDLSDEFAVDTLNLRL